MVKIDAHGQSYKDNVITQILKIFKLILFFGQSTLKIIESISSKASVEILSAQWAIFW